MQSRGSGILARSSKGLLILVMLSGIVLLILRYLIKPIMLNKEAAINILGLLTLNGFNPTLAKFAQAQAAHETNGFNSRLFTDNNNAFGMKYAKQILSVGEKKGFANYNSVNDSVKDLIKWYTINRNKIFSLPLVIVTLKDYVNFLKRNKYFEDTEANYLKGVEYYYRLLNE